ncbi:HK97 family phage prohead protease, partial [Bacillus licheniformis]
ALKAHTEEDGPKVISGYALKFGTRSHNLGGFIEIIDKRALDHTDLSDVRALIDHDPSKILGRVSAGTLKLDVDDVGLRFDITLP